MANMSNAYGVCIMCGESEQLETLYSIMDELKGVAYSTDIFECNILDSSDISVGGVIREIIDVELPLECVNNLDIDSLVKRVLSNNAVLVSGFQGFGKGVYKRNVENLLSWLQYKLSEQGLSVPNSLDGVELTFIYVDEEGGCASLAHEQYTIRLELDGKHLVQKDIEFITNDYEYNAENLMKMDIFDECYDLTPDNIPNLLLKADEDELEYLGLGGLVNEHSVKNIDTSDLIQHDYICIISRITDLRFILNIDKLRKRLKELKDNETCCKI